MSHRTTTLICLFALLQSSCRQPEPTPVEPTAALDPSGFSGTDALVEVREFVALGPRHSGSDGAESAARYIVARLHALGVTAEIDEFPDRSPTGKTTFRNVIATIPGRKPGVIVVASHYDTKAGISDDFAGANDSGSSTGLLLHLASILQNGPPPGPNLILAFLDGEECMRSYSKLDGLHGSRRLAKQLSSRNREEPVLAVLVVDMIGDSNLSITIPRNCSPELVSMTFKAASTEGVRAQFSYAPGAILDDHVPFMKAGMPAVDLIDFEFGSAPGKNDYWHTTEDTMDKLSAESLQTTGRVIIHMLNTLTTRHAL